MNSFELIDLDYAERLSGGNINFVYRAKADANSFVIVKKALPYLACDNSISMSVDRIINEKEALEFLQTVNTFSFKIPKPFYFKENILWMEDAGHLLPLNETILSGALSVEDAKMFGKNLALLLNELQSSKKKLTQTSSHMYILLKEQLYDFIKPLLTEAGISNASEHAEFALSIFRDAVNEKYGLIMGDLWPNSLQRDEKGQFWIIDWEFCANAHTAIDCAHFVLWMSLWYRKSHVVGFKEVAQSLMHHVFKDDNFWRIFWVHFAADLLLEVRTGDWYSSNEGRLSIITEAAKYFGKFSETTIDFLFTL